MRIGSLFAVLSALAGAAVVLAPYGLVTEAHAADEHYSAQGVVKSFGPKRAYVNIAHERIPGYMEAMTMSFEPRSDQQLAGIEIGAHVTFSFTATADGRRVLDAIVIAK